MTFFCGFSLTNEAATPFFGTTRYTKREGRIPKVYYPESGECVSALSHKGVRTVGRLALAIVAYDKGQIKTKHLKE